MHQNEPYVRALWFRWLTGLYDPVLRLFFDEKEIRRRLIEQMTLANGFRVLDLGCGTGTLLAMIRQGFPGIDHRH